MLCAHTVRRLKPGAYDQFRETFGPPEDAPAGWVRFHMLRNVNDENEVVTFGFFDGTLDELNASQGRHDYQSRVDDIAPLVESVVSNGIFEIVESRTTEGATA